MPIATLDELIHAVRAEIGDSTNASMGVDALPAFRQLLNRVQESYYLDFDWPNLIFNPEESVVAGERYYTFDDGVNFERIFKAWVLTNGRWVELDYGIEPEHYNASNPDLGETESYPRRWCHYDGNQFEIWPVPNQDTKIKFRCIRALPRMVAGTDECLLDATLLILAAASEMATRNKLEDAKVKLSLTSAHYMRLKGRYNKTRVVSMVPTVTSPTRCIPRAPR